MDGRRYGCRLGQRLAILCVGLFVTGQDHVLVKVQPLPDRFVRLTGASCIWPVRRGGRAVASARAVPWIRQRSWTCLRRRAAGRLAGAPATSRAQASEAQPQARDETAGRRPRQQGPQLGTMSRCLQIPQIPAAQTAQRYLPSRRGKAISYQLERCMAAGEDCPGYVPRSSGHRAANTPVENAICYNDAYMELRDRAER